MKADPTLLLGVALLFGLALLLGSALLLRSPITAPFNRHPSIIHHIVNARCDNFSGSRIDFLIKRKRRKGRAVRITGAIP